MLSIFTLLLSIHAVLSMATERMILTPSMKAANLGKAFLTTLKFDTDAKTVSTTDTISGNEAIQEQGGKHGSVCFVVRRPG